MSSASSERDPFEQLAEDFLARYRAGERPSISEYAEQHPELAGQIQELLPALVALEEHRPGGAAVAEPASGAEGRTVPPQLGEYRILREIGRGGMGVVYEAEQEALGRRVALKVLPFAHLLLPTHRERFRREARAAARLHHTNIVPVFGVGEQDGLHYYAMQFIQGQGLDKVLHEVRRLREIQHEPASVAQAPILQAASAAEALVSGQFLHAEEAAGCRPTEETAPAASAVAGSTWVAGDRSELTTQSVARYCRSVARVGVQVADALAYAHQHGVIHRDVKPSNLLLDTHGTVWVTDFGLAHQLEAETRGEAPLTGSGDVVGTLRYMAPERLEGVSDPRGDVYSLGLTLYELLTLRSAFDEADRARLLDRVRHDEPSRPRDLERHIPRDLETIILKATAREPSRRYPTAEALAEDLRRFLADQPIRARRARLWELLVKWVRRRPAAAGLLLVSILALLTLLTGAVWHNAQLAAKILEVEAQQRQVQKETERAEANFSRTLEAVDKFLSQVGQRRLENVPGLEPVRREVLEEALRFFQSFLQEKGNEPSVRAEATKAYFRMGHIYNLLGQHPEAEQSYRRSLELAEQLAADFPAKAEYRRDLADAFSNLAILLNTTCRLGEAEPVFRRAVALSEELARAHPAVPAYRNNLAYSISNLGPLLEKTGHQQEAEQTFRRAVDLQERLVAEFPTVAVYRDNLARSHNNLGTLLQRTGRPPEAEPAFRRAVELWEGLAAEFPRQTGYRDQLASGQTNLGVLLRLTARPLEAASAHRRAVELFEKLAADFPSVPDYRYHVAKSQLNLSALLQGSGQTQEAEKLLCRILEILERLVVERPGVPEYRRDLAGCHSNLGKLLLETDRAAEGEKLFQRALDLRQQLATDFPAVPEYQGELAVGHFSLAVMLADTDRLQKADESYRRAWKVFEKLAADYPTVPDYRHVLGATLHNLATLPHNENNLGEARRLLEQAIGHQQLALKSNPRHPVYREYLRNHYWSMTETLVRAEEHREAAQWAARLPPLYPTGWEEYHRAAGFLARCMPLAEKDARLPEAERQARAQTYADQAMAWLREAVAKGCKDAAQLTKDKALVPLHARADFRELVRTLEAKAKPQ